MKGANSAEGTTCISFSSKLLPKGNVGNYQVCPSFISTMIASRVMRSSVAIGSEILSYSLMTILIVSNFRAVLAVLSVLKDSTCSS